MRVLFLVLQTIPLDGLFFRVTEIFYPKQVTICVCGGQKHQRGDGEWSSEHWYLVLQKSTVKH